MKKGLLFLIIICSLIFITGCSKEEKTIEEKG